MRIETIVTGSFACNNYLVVNEQRHEAVLVDCGDDASKLQKSIQSADVQLSAILLTHGHADHLAAADQLAKVFRCPIYAHEEDQPLLNRALFNLSPQVLGRTFTLQTVPHFLRDGERIELAGFCFDVIHTPGHTLGSVCYRLGNHLFTGDTLFYGSVGGDLPPFGDLEREIHSIKLKLFSIDQDCTCYPGHGCITTLGFEKENNQYCKD